MRSARVRKCGVMIPPGRGHASVRLGVVCVAVFALTVTGAVLPAHGANRPDPAGEQLQLPTARQVAPDPDAVPAGWTYRPGPRSARLEWTSATPIPIGDAPVEFWLGQQRLGEARPLNDGSTFRLDVSVVPTADLNTLRVTRGGVALGEGAPRGVLPRNSPTPGAPLYDNSALRPIGSDPGKPGPYDTTSSTYRLAPLTIAEYEAPVEMLGRVIRPVDAAGPRPFAVFLHGRHSTCFKGNRTSGAWPCRSGWEPIPSYLGYLESQRLLASQGYVTVSISANGINGQDWISADGGAEARSRLVRRHLSRWASWTSTGGGPFGSDLVGAVDMDRVVLVGHSRGGEGVNRAAIDSVADSRWTLAGQVLIGPTAFGRQTLPGLNTVVLLPFCDGDVSDLQGQEYVDQSRDIVDDTDKALRSAVMVMGANHNYFNREWTPGLSVAPSQDDWWADKDPLCGKTSPARLSPGEQRDVGSTYIAAAAHVFAEGNQRQLPLIDGTPVRAPSADPAVTHVTAIGANRAPVYRAAGADVANGVGGVTSRLCAGWGSTLPTCARRQSSPHFLPMSWQQTDPAPVAWEASWRRASGRAQIRLPQPVDLSSAKTLELRVAPEAGPKARFGVVLYDGDGTRIDVGTSTVRHLPSTRNVDQLWARSVRLPLGQVTADLADISKVALVPKSRSGHLYVLDVHGRSPGLDAVRPQQLPRLDVVDAEVLEGNGGNHVANLRVTVEGAITEPLRFWMELSEESGAVPSTDTIVTLSPGDTYFDVPIVVRADRRDDYDKVFTVQLRALSQVVTGHYVGSLTVRDDDPTPQATVTPSATAVEGEPLEWTVSLDHPSDLFVSFDFELVAPAAGLTELSTDDVPHRWLNKCGQVPATPKPMSRARFFCTSVFVAPRETEGSLVIRTTSDDRVEGDESVAWRLVWAEPEVPDPPWQLTGTVSDG